MATYTPPPYFPQGSLAPPDKKRYRKFKLLMTLLAVIIIGIIGAVGGAGVIGLAARHVGRGSGHQRNRTTVAQHTHLLQATFKCRARRRQDTRRKLDQAARCECMRQHGTIAGAP